MDTYRPEGTSISVSAVLLKLKSREMELQKLFSILLTVNFVWWFFLCFFFLFFLSLTDNNRVTEVMSHSFLTVLERGLSPQRCFTSHSDSVLGEQAT